MVFRQEEISVTNRKKKQVRLVAIESSLCLNLIKGESKLNCYIREVDRYFLVIRAGQFVDSDLRKQVLRYKKILIEKGQYNKYLKDNLNNIAKDTEIPFNNKSEIIYTTATNIVEDLLSNPNSENIQSSIGVSNIFLEHILEDDKALHSLMRVTSYDYYTYTHSIDVTIYSLSLGKAMELSESDLERLGTSAILHDIGKSKIDSSIVNKAGRLTDEEFAIMKKHPLYGYEIAKKNGVKDEEILSGIRHHHEKLDGFGYPDRLRKEQLGIFPQIIAVADIFDALTTKRSYKEAFSSFDALLLMKKEMSHQLNKKILEKFINLLYFGG